MHDVKADAAQRRVLESLGDCTDDAKPELPPESYSGFVCLYDGVELHRSVPLAAGPRERVLAERTSDPTSPCIAGDHEARRRDVRARPRSIRPHLRCTEHARAVQGYDRETGR